MKKYKLVIFDLDDVLIKNRNIPELHDDTINVLNALKHEKYMIALCSHNCNASKILDRHNIKKYFGKVAGYCKGDTKIDNLKDILAHYPKLDVAEMIFFDDLIENINLFKEHNIDGCLISPKTGITMRHLYDTNLIDYMV